MNGASWTYTSDLRAMARTTLDGYECMRHSNASAPDIEIACVGLRAKSLELREIHGTVVASDTPVAFEINCTSDLRELGLELERLAYELESHAAMIRSPFDFGDRVEVGPAWRMGPVEGDGGTYHPDAVTGKQGVVSGTFADGDDIIITAPNGHVYWIPVSRLTVAGL